MTAPHLRSFGPKCDVVWVLNGRVSTDDVWGRGITGQRTGERSPVEA